MLLLVFTYFYLQLSQTSKKPTRCEGCSQTGAKNSIAFQYSTPKCLLFFSNASSLRQKSFLALAGR